MAALTIGWRAEPRARRATVTPATLRLLTLAAVLVAWEVFARLFLEGSLFLAGPVDIALALPGTINDPDVREALAVTAGEFLLAFSIATVAGVLLGAMLGATRRAFGPGRNLLQMAFSLPQVALYPLFVLWLGIGFSSKVVFGVTHGIFPVLLGTMAATKLVDANLITSVRAMGGGRATVIRKVVLPSILPDVVSSLRVAAALTLLGVLLAELMVSVGGVGAILHGLSSSFNPARLYALVATVCAAAVAVNLALGYAERRLSVWRS
jgi:ABC-type nitrate/sulfonate/bicarbonate transport system permease component